MKEENAATGVLASASQAPPSGVLAPGDVLFSSDTVTFPHTAITVTRVQIANEAKHSVRKLVLASDGKEVDYQSLMDA